MNTGVIDIETEKLVAFCMNAVTAESCEYRTIRLFQSIRNYMPIMVLYMK